MTEKPFYMQPPWHILFEIHKLEKLEPWKVNISYLLDSFLEEMKQRNEVDFRASGVALDSSAFIYLMKSKLLLKLEEPPVLSKLPADIIPPPIFLPLRYELTSTTIEQLLDALNSVLKGERISPPKPRVEPILPEITELIPQVDTYLLEIETLMEEQYNVLVNLGKNEPFLKFTKLVLGKNKIDKIRVFILLLFLAQKGRIWLWQESEFNDIYISLNENSFVDKYGADVA